MAEGKINGTAIQREPDFFGIADADSTPKHFNTDPLLAPTPGHTTATAAQKAAPIAQAQARDRRMRPARAAQTSMATRLPSATPPDAVGDKRKTLKSMLLYNNRM